MPSKSSTKASTSNPASSKSKRKSTAKSNTAFPKNKSSLPPVSHNHDALDIPAVQDKLLSIKRLNHKVTPGAVVKAAKPPSSPLHPAFEWNDSTAANNYRLHQAASLIKTVHVSSPPPKNSKPKTVSLKLAPAPSTKTNPTTPAPINTFSFSPLPSPSNNLSPSSRDPYHHSLSSATALLNQALSQLERLSLLSTQDRYYHPGRTHAIHRSIASLRSSISQLQHPRIHPASNTSTLFP